MVKISKKLRFSEWQHISKRESTTDPEGDIPKEFDFAGLYLFAQFKTEPAEKSSPGKKHLIENVIYIGESMELTCRLEGNKHEKIKEYKSMDHEPSLEYLYYSTWEYNSSLNFRNEPQKVVIQAFILFMERKCIFEYAEKYNHLPSLNYK